MGLSAVVITYNEEANLERCLRSLRFADEVAVLDSMSTDRTLELAREYADVVSQREFTGFSDQKNAAIKLASQEWILFVDADEVIGEELAAEIRGACESAAADGYWIPRLAYFLGRPIRHCGWYPDCQLRLARLSKARFPDRLVHESMEVDGTCAKLKHDLLHYSFPSLDDFMRKMVPYARAAAEQKMRDGRQFRFTDLLFNPTLTFMKTYVVKQGFKDGMHGFVLCVLMACSSALRYSMLWEMTKFRGKKKEYPG